MTDLVARLKNDILNYLDGQDFNGIISIMEWTASKEVTDRGYGKIKVIAGLRLRGTKQKPEVYTWGVGEMSKKSLEQFKIAGVLPENSDSLSDCSAPHSYHVCCRYMSDKMEEKNLNWVIS